MPLRGTLTPRDQHMLQMAEKQPHTALCAGHTCYKDLWNPRTGDQHSSSFEVKFYLLSGTMNTNLILISLRKNIPLKLAGIALCDFHIPLENYERPIV